MDKTNDKPVTNHELITLTIINPLVKPRSSPGKIDSPGRRRLPRLPAPSPALPRGGRLARQRRGRRRRRRRRGRRVADAELEVVEFGSAKTGTTLGTGWWFGTFFIFPYIGNNHPNWLIFFRGVQTTNQGMSWKIWGIWIHLWILNKKWDGHHLEILLGSITDDGIINEVWIYSLMDAERNNNWDGSHGSKLQSKVNTHCFSFSSEPLQYWRPQIFKKNDSNLNSTTCTFHVWVDLPKFGSCFTFGSMWLHIPKDDWTPKWICWCAKLRTSLGQVVPRYNMI